MRTYIDPQTQPGDFARIQSYRVQQPCTGSDCKYNQSTLLNLSTENKQNDVVIVNPKNNKENMKIHIHIPCTFIFIIHISTHIYKVNTGQETVFMAKLFLLNKQNKGFHDIFTYVVFYLHATR